MENIEAEVKFIFNSEEAAENWMNLQKTTSGNDIYYTKSEGIYKNNMKEIFRHRNAFAGIIRKKGVENPLP